LREEEVPPVRRKSWGNTRKHGEEVILEGTNGALCRIAPVDMWWNKLDGASVSGDGLLEIATCFIVQNVNGRFAVNSSKSVIYVFVGSNAVGVVFGSKWSYEDGIGRGV